MSCTRIVTYDVLSARRAHRIRDINEEINAHIIGLSGRVCHSDVPGMAPCTNIRVSRQGDTIGIQPNAIFEHAGVSIIVHERKWKPRKVVRTFDTLQICKEEHMPSDSETGRKTSLRS